MVRPGILNKSTQKVGSHIDTLGGIFSKAFRAAVKDRFILVWFGGPIDQSLL